jgi:hypothetical protein
MQNIAHGKPGGCNSRLLFSQFINTHKFSERLERAANWPIYHLKSAKKFMHFHLRTIEEHTGCTPWVHITPYSVKLFSSLLWTEAFRNTRNGSKPGSIRKGHSFPQRFSGVQNSTPFPHGTEHTLSVRLKAVPQSDFDSWTCILKISKFQIEQEKSQTHTHTQTHTHSQSV